MADVQFYEGVGRRKASTARARLYVGGSGKISVNDKEAAVFFSRQEDLFAANAPLALTGANARYNASVHVSGGGVTGQAEAVRMAISRALLEIDPEYRSQLKAAGYLTRDPREKERKKPGLKRARKAPTYTKR
jgi:small subunit ribosomal protein S9